MALASALLVVFPAAPADAVDRFFEVNSLSSQGDDVAPGDGVCATSTGLCTLRAALQESNALPVTDTVVIAPAEDVDADTPGIQTSGTIVGFNYGAAYMMYVGTLTPWGDAGAYFMATRAVTMDFQNRLGIASLNDGNGATAIYINGPGVVVRNFSNIKSNETAFVVGPNGDGAVIENGSSIDPGSINLERVLWLASGADSVTVRRVEMGSTYAGGGGAVMIAPGAVVSDLTLDRVRMYDPDTEGYYGLVTGNTSVVNRLRIVGSTFEGFQSGYYVLDLRGTTLMDAVISGNTFKRININAGTAAIWFTRQGTNNVISNNTFSNDATSAAGWSVYASALGLTATQNSGWRVEGNYFNGMRNNSVYVGAGSGILPVVRNTFGPLSYGGGTAANETDANAVVNNATTTANQGIVTWYPTSATVDAVNCELDVAVTPPVTAPAPAVPVRVDVYYTAATQAEIYLGGADGLTSAGMVSVPYTLGAGFIRVQTTAANGATSQYSRVVAQNAADACGPRVTVDQAAGQADPTSVRDVLFSVRFSEAVTDAPTVGEFSTVGSTAPGVSVTGVTRLSGSEFAVTARANGSGQIVLSLPAGAVADPAGNLSVASTSTDNVVMFVSPLSVVPASVTVTEGGPSQGYTVTSTLAATSPLTITPAVADAGWATVAPTPLTIATTQSSGTIQVAAVNDSVVNVARTTTIAHTVSSADPNFDGLVLPDVTVQVLDDDQPDAAGSSLAVSAGTRVANGVDAHTATVTVRNAAGVPVTGVLVTFQVPSWVAAPSGLSCVTVAGGTCSIPLTSTVAVTDPVRAFVGSTEIGGSPGSAVFVAGPWSPVTSTVVASVGSVPADGASTVTVTLFDAFGNRVTSSAGPATWTGVGGGTLSGETDHGDGTYSVLLTAPITVGAAVVSATIGGTSTRSVTINFIPGAVSPAHSTISADPDAITADGVSTSEVTVELRDAYDNVVSGTGDTVTMSTTAGTLSGVTPLGDGLYGATLTAPTTAGTATVSFAVNGVAAADTAVVALLPGAPDPGQSQIAADPTSLTADGVSQSAVRVVLVDALGNRIATGGATVTIATDLGTISAVRDDNDGSYVALLTAPTAPGTATLTATVGGVPLTQTATVHFLAGAADAASSLIVADPTTVVADGVATSTITVTVRDALGNVLTEGGADVEIATDLGSVGPVSDNGDGTYTAVLTSATTLGTATVTFAVNGAANSNSAAVVHVPGPANPAQSLIVADPPSAVADGTATSTITVTLRDAAGHPRPGGGDVVEINSTLGSLGSVLNNGDGTYTAFLASTTPGTATLSYRVNAAAGVATTTVAFVAGGAHAGRSTIEADPVSVVADGSSTSVVTVTLRDVNGNPLTGSAGVVVIGTDVGSVGATTDNGDGTYSATLTSSTVAGPATLSFTVDGAAGTNKATVAFVAGPVSLVASTIEADPVSVVADGKSTSVVTVTLRDAKGNQVAGSGGDVVVLASVGSVGAVTDNTNGTYTATLTSSTVAGTATLSFTLNGAAGTNEAEVAFVAGPVSVNASTIVAAPTSIVADGGSTSTVTVTLRDANGNQVAGSGGVVVVTASAGSVGATTDNGDGTYVATLTSSTVVETATLSFTVDAVAATGTAQVAFVVGAADPEVSTIEAAPVSVVADGSSTSVVTVRLFDHDGHALTSSGGEVVITASAGSVGATTDNGDGTYVATLTSSTVAGTATLSFTVEAVAATKTAQVQFVAGAVDAGKSTIEAAPVSIIADGSSTSTVTVQLVDANGNELTGPGGVVVIATDAGSVGATTNVGNGTYTATLTSATVVGTATLSFTVNTVAATSTAQVQFVAGSAAAATSTIGATPGVLVADGAATATVTLFDAQGNRVTTGGQVVTLSTSAGVLSSVTDVGDGTHTATLTAGTVLGTATVGFGVDGSPGTATASVQFVVAAPSPTASTIVAVPASVAADGVSTSAVTVTVRDQYGHVVADAGAVVTMSTTAGALGVVTDHGDGTYSAVLTAPVVAGAGTVSFTVAGSGSPNTAVVSFVPGAADPGRSTVDASPTVLVADGVSVSTVTVRLVDVWGNALTASGGTVVVTSSAGSVSATTDNGDGTYTAQLTAPTVVGTARVGFTVNGATADGVGVSFVAGSPDLVGATLLEAVPSLLTADGVSTSTVRLTVLDSFGNPVGVGGWVVVMQTDAGMLSGVTDIGDGTFTAVLTAPTTTSVPVATLTATLDGGAVSDIATVAFVAGEPSAQTSTITAAPDSLTADGSSTSAVTVTVRDGLGNLVTGAGGVVTVSTDLGVLGLVTDNGDGTYAATLTAGTVAGTATVGFAVNGSRGSQTAAVVFVPGPADAARSVIVASPGTVVADGVRSSAITVTLSDTNGNPVWAGGDTVALSTDLGVLGPVSDLGNGSYSATLTSPTTLGRATVTFAVAGAPGATSASVDFVAGPADPGTSTIVAVPAEFEAGSGSSLIKVALRDAQGNPVTGGVEVVITTTLGAVSAVAVPGDGTASASLTSAVVGIATVGFRLNGVTGTTTAAVAVVVVVVDTTPPDAPVITAPGTGGAIRPDAPISGTGEPGATLVVGSGTGVVCTAVVAADGTWSCFPIAPLPDGEASLTARQTDPAGNTSPDSPTITVTVDGLPPAPPVLNPVGEGKVTGTAEPGSTVTVRGPDGTVVCTAVTAADGTFACTLTVDLPEGTLLSVTATDEAGNVSTPALVRVGGPRITLDLTLASIGQTQTAHGLGFLPDESVTGLMESTPVDLGLRIADAGGVAMFPVVLPADLEPGRHRITLTGSVSGAVWAEFEVRVAAAVTADTPAPLAQSGTESGWLLRTAVLLVGIGGFLLGTRRRRTEPAIAFAPASPGTGNPPARGRRALR